MAETTYNSVGFSLAIDEGLIKRMQEADKLIDNLGKHSEKSSQKMITAFRNVGDKGVDYLISKLQEAQKAMAHLAEGKVSIDSGSLDNLSNAAVKTNTNFDKLYETITKVSKYMEMMSKKDLEKKSLDKQFSTFGGSMGYSFNADTYGKEAQAIKYLTAARNNLSKSDELFAIKRNALTEAINRHRESLRLAGKTDKEIADDMAKASDKKTQAALKEASAYEARKKAVMDKWYSSSPERALSYSSQTKSINDQIRAIKYLETARKNLSKENLGEGQYQFIIRQITDEINRQKKSVDELTGRYANLHNKTHNLLNISEQLWRRLALAFSVSQVTGYINNLIRVRGEFELQQRSLEAIIKNKDEADKLWSKTVTLAINSPFRIKELVTYTKQLAAYRIEASKLYETNKMLADISAGLGVDMNRLILAFGQVKAANYLRGCLGYNTPIRMYDGSIKMVQDVVVGDVLINENGEKVNVKELIRGREQMYIVRQSDGLDYRVNENHILTLYKDGCLYDIYVREYNSEYLGARYDDGKLTYGAISIEKDVVDDYFGFVLDGNKRFQLGDGTITHNTELRQFSEAGVNILGELAQYFSELENRAVSVGDVFARVSKRMVSFRDVENVLKRLTDEGGTFYRMQEIQAETIKGMMSNLQDSIDVMLNDIGKNSEGVIKTLINLFKTFIDNWKVFATILKGSLGLFIIFKLNALRSSNAVLKFAKNISIVGKDAKSLKYVELFHAALIKVGKGFEVAAAASKKFIAANWWLIAIGAAIKAIYELVYWNDKYNQKIEEINRKRDEERATLVKLSNEYKELTKNEKNESITSEENFNKKLQKLKELQQSAGLTSLYIPIEFEEITKDNIDEIFGKTEDVISYMQDLGAEFGAALARGLSGKEGSILGIHFLGDNLETDLKDMDKALTKIGGSAQTQINILIKELEGSYDKLSNNAKLYLKILKKGRKENELQYNWYERQVKILSSVAKEFNFRNKDILENASSTYMDVTSQIKEVERELDKVIKRFLDANKVENFADLPKEQQVMLQMKIDEAFEQMELSDQAKRISAFYTANAIKIPYRLTPAKVGDEQLSDWAKRYNEFIKTLGDTKLTNLKEITDISTTIDKLLSQLNDTIKGEENVVNRAAAGSQAYTKEEVRLAKIRLKANKEARSWLVGMEQSGDDKQKNILNSRISLIKEVNKAYLDLAKTFDVVTAKEKVIAAYANTFDEAFKGTGINITKIVSQIKPDVENAGAEIGSTLTDEVKKKIEELSASGTYIRTFSDDFVEQIKKREGFSAKPYWDKAGKKWTQGYGETKGVTEKSSEITKEIAETRLRNRLSNDFAREMNNILDKHKELVFTQEQYNQLLDVAYQGGSSKIENLIKQASDIEVGVQHIRNIYNKVKEYVGEDAAQRFGDSFIQKFKEAETIYDRMALLLQTTNLLVTRVDEEAKTRYAAIDKDWYAGMQSRSDSRSSIFSGDLDIANAIEQTLIRISLMDFTSAEGMIDALEQLRPLAEKQGKEAVVALEKEISSIKATIDIDIKKGSDKQLVSKIEDMLSDYKFYLEIDKLNIPQDIAKNMYGITTTSLEEIKSELLSMQDLFVGEDMLEKYDSLWKSILDMENKAQMDRLKNYTKYLTKATSEFVQIKLKSFDEIAEIKKAFTLTQPFAEKEFGINATQWGMLSDTINETKKSYSELTDEEWRAIGVSDEYISKIREYLALQDENARKAISGVKRDTDTKLQKQQWEDFKSSDMYVLMFEDIENLGTKALENLRDKLDNLKKSLSSLPADQVKEIVNQINKIDDTLVTRNPFGAVAKYAKEIRKYHDLQTLQIELINAESEIGKAQNVINIIDEVTSARDKGNLNLISDDTIQQYNNIVALAKAEGKEVSNIRGEKQGIVNDGKKEVSNIKEGITANAKYAKSLKALSDWWGEINDKINSMFDSGKKLMTTLGEESDSTNMVIAEISQNMVSLVLSTIQMTLAMKAAGKAANSALGVIGWIAMALEVVVNLFSSLFGQKDKKLQKQIEELQESVKQLEWSFDRLKNAMSDAFSLSDLESYTRQARVNLNAQIKSYKMMIEAERAKKSSDKSQIAEWQRTINDLQIQLLEVAKDAFDKATGDILDNTLSAANEYTNAWLEAFQKTGSGLSGLTENFKEATLEMVKQQASLFITGTYADRWKKNLEQYINANDLELTTQEANAWMKSVQTELPMLNAALEQYFNAMKQAGLDLSATSNSLSGLQKGIQGITENQADEIAAYLNTIRFFVSENNELIKSFYSIFSNDSMANPMIAELKAQTALIRTIKDMLGSVIGRGASTHNGAYLKVAL